METKWQLKIIDRSNISKPTKPVLKNPIVVEYDPRMKVYGSPTHVNKDEECRKDFTNEKNLKNNFSQWENLEQEEILFYKEINLPQQVENTEDSDVVEKLIDEILDESFELTKNSVGAKNESGVDNPWNPKDDMLENSRKRLQSILQKQSFEITENSETNNLRNLTEEESRTLLNNQILEKIRNEIKIIETPNVPKHPTYPEPEELVMPLSIPKPRESSFDRELRRLKEDLESARKNNVLDDLLTRNFKDRSTSKERAYIGRRRSRSRSRDYSPAKRKKRDRSDSRDRLYSRRRERSKSRSRKEKYEKEVFTRRRRRSRSYSRERSTSHSRSRKNKYYEDNMYSRRRRRSRSYSRDRSKSRSRSKSKAKLTSEIVPYSRRRSKSRSNSREKSHKKTSKPDFHTITTISNVQEQEQNLLSSKLVNRTETMITIEQKSTMLEYDMEIDEDMDDEDYLNQTSSVIGRKQWRKARAKEVFCSVCSIFVNTQQQYEIHAASKKHKKKEKLWQALSQLKPAESIATKMITTDTPDLNLVCEVCKMYKFTSVDSFNAHMMSKKHKSNLVESMNFLYNANSNDSDANDVDPEEIQRCLNTFSQAITEKEKIAVEVKNKRRGGDNKSLYCEICDVHTTGEISYIAHLNSKKHKKKLMCDSREFTRAGISDPALRYMYVPGRGVSGSGGGPTLGLPGGWGSVVRPPTSVAVGAGVTAPADLLATISMFEQHVKAEPIGFYAPPTSTATNRTETNANHTSSINATDEKNQQLTNNVICATVVASTTKSTAGGNATTTGSSGHSRSKPQACKVCGKVLSSASSYYVHMKLHSGNKPFACTCCEAAFCRKPYLEVHMRTHTGERPFQCELCMKRFTQKSSLNTHKRVHTGERPYACDICEKRFAVKSYVTAHRWSHVADKPLTCDRCSLTFTSKSQFAIHIRTHSAAQSYECNICGRTFVRDSYLIRHHNRVHRENPTQVAAAQTQTQNPNQSAQNASNNANNSGTFTSNGAQSLRYVTTSTQMSPIQDKSSPSSVGPPSVGP